MVKFYCGLSYTFNNPPKSPFEIRRTFQEPVRFPAESYQADPLFEDTCWLKTGLHNPFMIFHDWGRSDPKKHEFRFSTVFIFRQTKHQYKPDRPVNR